MNRFGTDARPRIIKAARELFAEHGFARAKMDQTARRAGMSVGNLYRYFPSKEALVHEVVDEVWREVEEPFSKAATLDDFERGIASHYDRHLHASELGFARLQVAIWAEASRDATVSRSCRRFEARVRGALRRLAGRGSRREADAAFRVITLVSGGLYRRRASEQSFAPDPEIGIVRQVIHRRLGALRR